MRHTRISWAVTFTLLLVISLLSPAYADHKTTITLTISNSSSGGGDSDLYLLTIPDALAATSSGWTAFDGGMSIKTIDGHKFGEDNKLVISADSANNWTLVLSPDKKDSVSYTLNVAKTDTTPITTFEYSAASVDAGVSQDLGVIIADITGKTAGTYEDTITFHAEVQDVPPVIEPASITLNPKDYTAYINEVSSFTLTATILPENATDKTVTWSSDDESVAKIDSTEGSSAVIKIFNAGTATITAKTSNGKTATCDIDIEERDLEGDDE